MPKPQDRIGDYLTKRQAAQILGVSTRTVERLVSRGILTAKRPPVGRRIFFDRKQVEALKDEIITPVGEDK